MSMKSHVRQLKRIGACSNAVEFVSRYQSLQDAWDACPNVDWMLWLMNKTLPSITLWDAEHRKLMWVLFKILRPRLLVSLRCQKATNEFSKRLQAWVTFKSQDGWANLLYRWNKLSKMIADDAPHGGGVGLCSFGNLFGYESRVHIGAMSVLTSMFLTWHPHRDRKERRIVRMFREAYPECPKIKNPERRRCLPV